MRPLARSPLRAILLLGLTIVGAGALLAQAPLSDEARAVGDRAIGQLRSPYCPGLMLEVCPSAPAAALRDSLYQLAEQGRPADEIVEWVIARHGEEWRAVPRRSGAGVWAWVLPPLFLLSGLALVVLWLRSRGSRLPAEGPAPEDDLSTAERAELAAALREMEHSEDHA